MSLLLNSHQFLLWSGIVLFVLSSPCSGADTFLPPDPKAPFQVECDPQPEGQTYRVITWTQINGVSKGGLHEAPRLTGVARAVIYGGMEAVTLGAPLIRIDGQTDSMYNRVPLNPDVMCFPVAVFEYPIHGGHQKIEMITSDGAVFTMPSLKSDARVLGVLGNSGCLNSKDQDCNSGQAWPFSRIAADLAEQEPDLVIHTGNFRFSKTRCQLIQCSDNWQNWLAEFFLPALPLLKKVPVVFVRGVRETCEDGGAGEGWFFLLQPQPIFRSRLNCGTKKGEPGQNWFFDVGLASARHRFLILDSADINNKTAPSSLDLAIKETLGMAQNAQTATLITHQPVWAVTGKGEKNRTSPVLQNALHNELPKNIKLVQSGLVPAHEVIEFGSGQPVQLVTGNSGVALNRKVKKVKSAVWGGQKAKVQGGSAHGYDLWIRNDKKEVGWECFSRLITKKGKKEHWVKTPALLK